MPGLSAPQVFRTPIVIIKRLRLGTAQVPELDLMSTRKI